MVGPDDLSVVLFCEGIVRALQNKGNTEIFVICDVHGEDHDNQYSSEIKSWGVHHVPIKMDRHINPLKDLKFLISLYCILRKRKIDAVINTTTKPNIYGSIAAKLAGVKNSMCSVWGRGTAYNEERGIKNITLRLISLGLYSIAFRLCDKAWFTNRNDLDYFASKNIVSREKTILTKNYVNTEDYTPDMIPDERRLKLREELGLETEDKLVIMVGRMIWAKGVGEFIEAARLLVDKLPGVKFLLVGPDESGSPDVVPADYLKNACKLNNFKLLGFRKDVKDLYSLSDLAVLPSYYREGGYPRALTEPMAMGKAVIAADSEDCRNPVDHGKNGYLVPVKDPHSLANAIESIMTDDEKRKQFGISSRIKAVEEYDERRIVEEVVNLFLTT